MLKPEVEVEPEPTTIFGVSEDEFLVFGCPYCSEHHNTIVHRGVIEACQKDRRNIYAILTTEALEIQINGVQPKVQPHPKRSETKTLLEQCHFVLFYVPGEKDPYEIRLVPPDQQDLDLLEEENTDDIIGRGQTLEEAGLRALAARARWQPKPEDVVIPSTPGSRFRRFFSEA